MAARIGSAAVLWSVTGLCLAACGDPTGAPDPDACVGSACDVVFDGSLRGFAESVPKTMLPFVRSDLSGITWVGDRQTYLLIENDEATLFEVDEQFRLLNTTVTRGFGDAEDLVWLGGDEFAVVNESGSLLIGEIPAGTQRLNAATFQNVVFAPHSGNKGPEGVAFDAASNTFYAVKEKDALTVYRLTRPTGSQDVMVAPSEPFDGETVLGPFVTDLSSVFFEPTAQTLWIMSHESGRVIEVELGGRVIDELRLPELSQFEGLTVNGRGELVVVAEPNYYSIYVDGR